MSPRPSLPPLFPSSCTIAFQGALGAYSQIALQTMVPLEGIRILPCEGFLDVFTAVDRGMADFGVLPVENALTGSIHDNFDLYLRFPELEIVAEYQLRIRHNLIGIPGASVEGIRSVYSHVQGLLQCSKFLDAHPAMTRVPHYDTAGSVVFVKESGDPSKAAIASALAARINGMEILEEGIETNHQNYTRFALVRRSSGPHAALVWAGHTKASLVFGLSDTPGSLLDALGSFARRGFNLKKIESRPIHGRPFEYMFYVDVDLGDAEPDLPVLCKELEQRHGFVRLLGSYPVWGDR